MMVETVGGDFVAAVLYLSYQVGEPFSDPAEDEEGCANVGGLRNSIKKVEDSVCIFFDPELHFVPRREWDDRLEILDLEPVFDVDSQEKAMMLGRWDAGTHGCWSGHR